MNGSSWPDWVFWLALAALGLNLLLVLVLLLKRPRRPDDVASRGEVQQLIGAAIGHGGQSQGERVADQPGRCRVDAPGGQAVGDRADHAPQHRRSQHGQCADRSWGQRAAGPSPERRVAARLSVTARSASVHSRSEAVFLAHG